MTRWLLPVAIGMAIGAFVLPDPARSEPHHSATHHSSTRETDFDRDQRSYWGRRTDAYRDHRYGDPQIGDWHDLYGPSRHDDDRDDGARDDDEDPE